MMLQSINQHSMMRMDASLVSIFTEKEEKEHLKNMDISRK